MGTRGRSTVRADIVAVDRGTRTDRRDRLAGEEPLEIRAAGPTDTPVQVAVTMRTPGRDFELAAGFLFGEGLIDSGDIARVSYCDLADRPPPVDVEPGESDFNIVTVRTKEPFDGSSLGRNFFMSSSCGICGTASLDHLDGMLRPVGDGPRVKDAVIAALPERLRSAQKLFEETGGLHAAGIFRPDGDPVIVREDVGRHNALDKAIGAAVLKGEVPLTDQIVAVSGRASYELIQKTLMAGCTVLCAVSAPSSLAVDAAQRFGLTLVGFLRGETFNIYSHPHRILGTEGA